MAKPRILAVDVGTGTQDILVFEAGTVIENAVQMVMPSPTMLVAARVRQATADRKDLLLTGVTMGGGPGHWAVESHLSAGLRVFATPQAARTFDDDLDRVQAMGISGVDDDQDAGGGADLNRGRTALRHGHRSGSRPGVAGGSGPAGGASGAAGQRRQLSHDRLAPRERTDSCNVRAPHGRADQR